jgi:hopene-associated glycosyltransferase HpnB
VVSPSEDVPVTILIALLSLLIWFYLLLGRGFFWRAVEPTPGPLPARWPSLVAVVPARNEAAVVGESIGSLLAQDYPGKFHIVLVDDNSSDGTAERAREVAGGATERLSIVGASPPPEGWTGKLWALSEGVRQSGQPELYLFTDADIAHHRSNLCELVARLEAENRDLVSLMVKLRCESAAERFLIPAFVFFFAMLYPFAWSNDPRKRTAAAAGGCILIRRAAYERAGGYAAITGALIDDCALARAVKDSGGRLWLGLSARTRSLRPYPQIADIWQMVARTAYTQLGHSPLLLAGTVLGLAVTYLAPPLLVLSDGWVFAAAAWLTMAFAYAPMLRFYGCSVAWAPALPAVALVYLAATLDSARRHWRGKGGEWKGRVQWQNRS